MGMLKPKNDLLSWFISLTKTWQQEFFTATVKWSLKEKFNGGFILHTSFNASLAVDPFTVEKVNFFFACFNIFSKYLSLYFLDLLCATKFWSSCLTSAGHRSNQDAWDHFCNDRIGTIIMTSKVTTATTRAPTACYQVCRQDSSPCKCRLPARPTRWLKQKIMTN